MTDSYDFAIEVVNLVKSYDGIKNAVDDVSFQIRPGEIYGLLGKKVAEGTSSQLKERFGSLKKLVLTATERIPEESIPRVKETLAGVPSVTQYEVSEREITVIGKNMGKTVYSILSSLSLLSIEIDQVNLDAPSLDDVFLEVVKK